MLPEGVVAVPQMTTKTAFFPGGRGLWNIPGSAVVPEVVILGQDFSTWDQHQEILYGKAEDTKTPTWMNLIAITDRVGLDLEKCFFTNAFTGLRRNGLSTGVFPGFKDSSYMEQNTEFLQLQLEVLQPRLIVVLGSVAPLVLARIGKGAEHWTNFNFRRIDQASQNLLLEVGFGQLRTNLVALVHPSMRFKNAGIRKFKGLTGDSAEIALLIEAMKISGIPRKTNGSTT
jgi:hypothetical protein